MINTPSSNILSIDSALSVLGTKNVEFTNYPQFILDSTCEFISALLEYTGSNILEPTVDDIHYGGFVSCIIVDAMCAMLEQDDDIAERLHNLTPIKCFFPKYFQSLESASDLDDEYKLSVAKNLEVIRSIYLACMIHHQDILKETYMNAIRYLHSDGEEKYWIEICKSYIVAKNYLQYLEET